MRSNNHYLSSPHNLSSPRRRGSRAAGSGFTLVELSVVLVIIGFIIAGVIVGQSMLRTAQLRAIESEFAFYKQAIINFRDKYQALPGDFASASSIFSGATNGDGDGQIAVNISNTRLDEQFLVWTHLVSAEMITGNFTGVAGSAGVRDRIPGQNIPASQLSESGWGIISVTLSDIAGGYTTLPYFAPDTPPGHAIWIGGRSMSGTSDAQKPMLTSKEAWEIDKKIDDGTPERGLVVRSNGTGTTGCATGSAGSRTYNISTGGMICTLAFKTGF